MAPLTLSKMRGIAQKGKQSQAGVSVASQSLQATSHTIHEGGTASSSTFRAPFIAPPPLRSPAGLGVPGTAEPSSTASETASQDEPSQAAPQPQDEPPKQSTDKPAKAEPDVFTDFESRKSRIVDLIYQTHSADNLGEDCGCGLPNAQRTTVCRECWHYDATCSHCFVQSHIKAPTHWAEVWSPDRGYFVRHDISALNGHPVIHIGHGGTRCRFVGPDDKGFSFIIVDTNGIHSTRIEYCHCLDAPEKAEQLLQARLFPATFRQCRMAFTFGVLDSYHVHHLESAESAYDYIASLRHLTDGCFFRAPADPYDQFRDVYKIWRFLKAEKHSGQHHGIDKFFPKRRPGNTCVDCAACLIPGVNTSKEDMAIIAADPRFRHLCQLRTTADGNYHANHYEKLKEPSQMSMFKGSAYFAEQTEYDNHIKRALGKGDNLEASSACRKVPCSYLTAVNKQDKGKFAGMDVSGIVTCQCPHIVIKAIADVHAGEKFVHTDFAVARWAELQGLTDLDPELLGLIDFLFSYDISCAYRVNALMRYEKNHPEMAPIIEKFRYLIPLLHVQNHKDNCMYHFACSYTEGAGHFHGETAEFAWPYLNLFGGQGRQMCSGNRHDLYIVLASHWNFKKMIGLASQLYNDLLRADKLRKEKLDAFLNLCVVHYDNLAVWRLRDRGLRDTTHKDKEVRCVYRHNPSDLPSQTKIYNALIEKIQEDEVYATSESAKSIPAMLDHSLTIRRLCCKIKCSLAAYGVDKTPSLLTTVKGYRTHLRKSLKLLRQCQRTSIPQLGDIISASDALVKPSSEKPETTRLCIPSDLTREERESYRLVRLAKMEYDLLEGAAYDSLERIRTNVRLLSAMKVDDKTQARGQRPHTRNQGKIENVVLQQEIEVEYYQSMHSALLRLGMSPDNLNLRRLTPDSLYRKSTAAKQSLGVTYQTDGMAWTGGGIKSANERQSYRPVVNAQASTSASIVGTQSSQPLKRKNKESDKKGKKGKKRKRDSHIQSTAVAAPDDSTPAREEESKSAGWIWQAATATSRADDPDDISDPEVGRYLNEGDSVQWFRAEAEVLRWQEEWELKLVEFTRTISYFEKMETVWADLGATAASPGMAAYAKKTSNRFRELAAQARQIFQVQAKYHPDATLKGMSILEFITADRDKLDALMEKVASSTSRDELDTVLRNVVAPSPTHEEIKQIDGRTPLNSSSNPI
ncbi:hypothetical protein DFP72DRAFT_1133715 [Ephemerocybe angulata]|uniref:CxC2-like cysteine cluster KDZ transposase-associated domain-containing protein n=1 Tax=Ephemerocybe angulata TaxID=980116 RepID=A0A8H6HVF8_9AGAR|nr:hypothetical protein DFP72DRAFT_1133715 [Tulosesus angulatus]